MMMTTGLALIGAPALAQTVDPAAFPAPAPGEFGPLAEVPDNLALGDIVGKNDTPHTVGEMFPDRVGAFRFECDPAHNLADDPVVYPGKPGRSHPHQFYGNNAINAFTTYATARTTGLSTCGSEGNRSGYWMPALISGNMVIRPFNVVIYYKREPKNSAECTPGTPEYAGICVSIPNGLRFIFGYDLLSDTVTTGGITFSCNINDGKGNPQRPGTIAANNMADAARGCKVGDFIDFKIGAPECWNGKDLDSANHRSHTHDRVKKANGFEACPASHPYYMPHFLLQAFYVVDENLNTTDPWVPGQKTWYLSSDIMFGMAPKKPGSTFHGDYLEAWKAVIKKAWTDNCIDKGYSCVANDLGNGYGLKLKIRQNDSPRYVPIPAGAQGPFLNNRLHAGH